MKKEYIIFDTNYINRIIDENNKYLNILNDLKNDYFFTINIGTFVEIMKKIINNQNKFKEVISLFEDYQFFIGEFENYKCIKVPNFSFQKFMEMTKKDRKKLFNEIYNNYYNFVCKFITFFLEYTLYALVLLITEDLKENKAYKKYLNLKSKEFHKEFLKCYCEKKELRIKDKFNIIVFRELKKIKHSDFNVNKDLLNSILNNYNETNLMNIFEATKKEEKAIKEMFWNFFYDRDIKEFLDSFNNEIFSKFAKDLFEKIIKRCGKLDGNDITDALIISGLNSKDYKLLTIDYKIQKFLKEEGLYSEELYKKIEQ